MIQLSGLTFEDKVEMEKWSDSVGVHPVVYLVCANDACYGYSSTHALVVFWTPEFDIRARLLALVGGLVVSNCVCVLEATRVRGGYLVAPTEIAVLGFYCEVAWVAVYG